MPFLIRAFEVRCITAPHAWDRLLLLQDTQSIGLNLLLVLKNENVLEQWPSSLQTVWKQVFPGSSSSCGHWVPIMAQPASPGPSQHLLTPELHISWGLGPALVFAKSDFLGGFVVDLEMPLCFRAAGHWIAGCRSPCTGSLGAWLPLSLRR